MNKFLEMLQESVIIQGTITLILVGATVYMFVTNQPVPETLTGMVMLTLGFYFGGKVENVKVKAAIDRMVEKQINQQER